MGDTVGKILPRPRGTYDPAAIYNIVDFVSHNNCLWLCKQQNTVGIEPTADNSDHWQLGVSGSIADVGSLGGQTADEWQQKIDDILNGTTPAGDSHKLGGYDPENFLLKTEIDAELSETSANPVQNRAITGALTDLENNIFNGTTPVGKAKDSEKLGGKGASEYALQSAVDEIQTMSSGTINAGTWARVAQYKHVGSNVSLVLNGYYPNRCYLTFKRTNYGANKSESHKILFNPTYGSPNFKELESNCNGSQFLTKIRYTTDETNKVAYIEVYNGSTVNALFQVFVSEGADYAITWQAITPTETAETVDGIAVKTTYDIPANVTPTTSADLANYLPKTGGDLTGVLGMKTNGGYAQVFAEDMRLRLIQYNSDTDTSAYRTITLWNESGQNINKAMQITQKNNSGSVSYNVLHTGNYSDYAIPKTGDSTKYGALTFTTSDDAKGTGSVYKNNSTTADQGTWIIDRSTSGVVSLMVRASSNNVMFRDLNGTDIPLATTQNLASYLPTTGGTIKGYSATPLNVNNAKDDTNNATIVTFQRKGTTNGGLGFYGANKPYYFNSSLSPVGELLHSGNVGDYALPVKGGNVGDGTQHTPFGVIGGTEFTLIQYKDNTNVSRGAIGFKGTNNPVVLDATAQNAYSIHHDGNSAKVAIQATAPTDTTALWVY